jgi:uncharacterized protein
MRGPSRLSPILIFNRRQAVSKACAIAMNSVLTSRSSRPISVSMPPDLRPKEPSVTDVLRPVAPQERIRALDLLRGWAMFGVLWSNLNDVYASHASVTTLDHALWWTQQWLLESRFYALLILLFGIGFGIQLLRAEGLATDLRNTYYRRSAALLAIGVVHGTLIWHGDILTIYALVAFALVMFRTASTRTLLAAAAILWFLGPIIVRESMFLSGLRFPVPGLDYPARTLIYAHGTWLQIERARVGEYVDWLGNFGLTSYVSILASFLVGLWSIKSGYLRRVIDEPRVTRRLLVLSLVAAAIGYARWHWAGTLWPLRPPSPNRAPAFPYPGFQLAMLRSFVLKFFDWATEGTAIAYACILLLLWQRPRGERLLRPLAATGRMALTTYLTQSIVCTLLFYNYGLGWYGSVGISGCFLITLILFACQMVASTWWLTRFRFGPVEWVWRTITYGRAPAMRMTPGHAFGF